MTHPTRHARGDGAVRAANEAVRPGRRRVVLPFFDPEGAPRRLLLVSILVGTLLGAPLGLNCALLGAFGGFIVGVVLAGIVTVAASFLPWSREPSELSVGD